MGFSSIDLRRDVKKLERLYNSTTSVTEREKILESMRQIVYIICEYDLEDKEYSHVTISNSQDDNIEKNSVYYGDLLHTFFYVPKYRMYFHDIKRFKDSLKPYINDDYVYENEPILILSNTEILDATREFYKSTSKKVYNYYDIFMKSNGNNIKFNKNKSSDDGFLFYSGYNNKKYIDIGTDGNCEDIIGTIVHEVGHAISYDINGNNSKNFGEIESIFFQLISCDFFCNYFNNLYFKDVERDYLHKYYIDAREMLFYKRAYNVLYKNLNKIDNPCSTFAELSLGDFKKSGEIPEIMNYLYSYIIACELTSMYKIDKENALNILENIIRNENNLSEYELIHNNVSPNKNLIKYIKDLGLRR